MSSYKGTKKDETCEFTFKNWQYIYWKYDINKDIKDISAEIKFCLIVFKNEVNVGT